VSAFVVQQRMLRATAAAEQMCVSAISCKWLIISGSSLSYKHSSQRIAVTFYPNRL
jgi:hypothetical protein